ncbi:hypothetical protein Q3G72_023134 [Acer saccharum]|nr:hypothetical protein Q3G72_023134 [Acer saccharum]
MDGMGNRSTRAYLLIVAVVVTASSIPVPQNQACISEANPSANAADSEASKCFFLNKCFVAMITCLNFKARIQRLLLLTLKSCPTVHGLCLDWFYHSTSILAPSSRAYMPEEPDELIKT